MPKLAVEVLRVIAFDPLPAAETHVDRAPGREQRRQCPHISGWRPATTEACRNPRIAGCIEQAARSRGVEFPRYHIEGLVPGNRDKTRILPPALLGIRPLHRVENAMGIVELLHENEGLDADLATRRMNLGGVEIGSYFRGDTVLDAHLQQVGTRHALITVGGDCAFAPWAIGGHGSHFIRLIWCERRRVSPPSPSGVRRFSRHRRRNGCVCLPRSARSRPWRTRRN